MNSIAAFRNCTLSNIELLAKVDVFTDEMFKKQEVPTRHIPARPNDDYDLLIGELIQRFQEKNFWIDAKKETPQLLENEKYMATKIYISGKISGIEHTIAMYLGLKVQYEAVS